MPQATDDQETLRAPTGTHDVLWPDSWRLETVVDRFRALVESAGYGLLQSPVFEYSAVFRKGIGEESEVVGREMYEFCDRDGKMLALRPEGTASVVRAYVQHRPPLPWKTWYLAPLLRHERPQAARYRQHHQVGAEAIGTADADLDVEVIWLANTFFRALGLRDFSLKLGSMGDAACRPGYIALLFEYLDARRDELCPDHRARLASNPMRVLDCKRPECRAATEGVPRLFDHLCEPCRAHFDRVREGLGALSIDAVLDHRLVRGFDYYTRTTFEFASGAIDAAQNALGGGGRYDALVEMLGGEPTPGVGFGIGVERVLIACDAEDTLPAAPPGLDAFVVDVSGGDAARDLTAALRLAGLSADRSFDARSMKAQMRLADRSGAAVALIVGPKEVAEGTVLVRPLRVDAAQRAVARDEVVATLLADRDGEAHA